MRTSLPQTLTGLALLALAASGCVGTGDSPASPSQPPTAGATASPRPSPSGSASPTGPAPSPSPSPTPAAATGPAAQDDGCPPPGEERATLPDAAAELPSSSNERITESPAGRTIDVDLVVLEGGPAAAEVTAAVRAEVEALVAAWDEAAGPPSGDDGSRPQPELELDVTTTRLGRQLVSFQLDGYEYLGGASGNAIADGWTFATATGARLGLEDVGLGGACTDELGGLAADALQAQGVGMFDEAEAQLRAGEISLERWSVTDEQLQLHFPPYEVAPGAAGAPTATVALADVHAATGTPLGAPSDG